jgi:uncharacterized membrane protein
MSRKTGVDTNETRERKRAEFSDPKGKKGSFNTLLIVAVMAAIAIAVYLVLGKSDGQPSSNPVVSTGTGAAGSSAGDVVIPIADLASGKARFFDYKSSDNKQVRFFVVKSVDGQYRAALDACDVCFQAKKGYRQEGDNMICQKCGLPFEVSRIGEVAGGCNPVGIPRTVEGSNLVIKAGELESRKSYF